MSQNPVLQAIADRRSNRGYTSDPITQEQLDALLTAAVQAPSARNDQPWHFTVVQNPKLLDEINTEAFQNMNRDKGDIFYAAPLVIFLSCDAESRFGRLDCGIAVQNLALAAHALGLGSVILGMPEAAFTGPKAEYFNKLFKFPEGHSFAIAIAIGVPNVTKDAHEVKPGKIDFAG